MARTLELVLTCLPVGRAAEMGAASVNHKKPVGSSGHPDAILLLPLGIDAERVVAGRPDRKMLEGSKIERGRKNRRNIRKTVISELATDAQTIRRRILLTWGSGVLSTNAAGALGFADAETSEGLATGGVRAAPPGVDGRPAPLWECWLPVRQWIDPDYSDYPNRISVLPGVRRKSAHTLQQW